MGLLDKINPRATVSSVIHHALLGGIVGAVGATVCCLAMLVRLSLAECWPRLVALTLLLTLSSMFVSAVFEWQVPEDSIPLLDLAFRLERRFGVRISRDQLLKMGMRNEPWDISVGELFIFIRAEAPQSGVLDLDLDAEVVWQIYQRAISDAFGIEAQNVTKDKLLGHDLGAW
jgi:hypothetical protein